MAAAAALAGLLGERLLGPGLEERRTTDALAGKGAVALYFGACWCRPCLDFTPKLAGWYEADLKGKGLEVVFVSCDGDEGYFRESFAQQPWLALPFEDRQAKERLVKKFGVRGVPSLVILDSEGRLITKSGRATISEDPTGARFPWRPRPLKELLADARIVGPGGETSSVRRAVEGKKALALYFSAGFSPPCRSFTPQLAEWYEKDLKSAGLEVVLVPCDRTEEAFREYAAGQPWPALDYGDRRLKEELLAALGIEGVPTLAVLDSDLNLVTVRGRAAVSADPRGAELPWRPRLVRKLRGGLEEVREAPTVVVACGSVGAEERRALEDALRRAAEGLLLKRQATGGEEPMVAFAVAEEGGAARRLLGMLGHPDDHGEPGTPRMALLDIPDNGGYYLAEPGAAITADSVEDFVAGYRAKKLERRQLP